MTESTELLSNVQGENLAPLFVLPDLRTSADLEEIGRGRFAPSTILRVLQSCQPPSKGEHTDRTIIVVRISTDSSEFVRCKRDHPESVDKQLQVTFGSFLLKECGTAQVQKRGSNMKQIGQGKELGKVL